LTHSCLIHDAPGSAARGVVYTNTFYNPTVILSTYLFINIRPYIK
jgi:hypothetical protein